MKDHQRRCPKEIVSCSGEECDWRGTRDKLAAHEETCQYIVESCQQCAQLVPRFKQTEHDCVKGLLNRFKSRGKELEEFTR